MPGPQLLVLSPHLDDAALSCGGLIRQLVRAGRPVRVVTLFAGHPGPDLSPFARETHRSWGEDLDPLARRKAEDEAALRVLGAESRYLAFRDALYRGEEGAWRYPCREALFGEIHPDDRDLPQKLIEALDDLLPRGEGATVYAPLAVGDHVDHQLAHQAALLLRGRSFEVVFYEDAPYAWRPGRLEQAREARGAQGWSPRLAVLADEELAAWVESVRAYRSQLATLFGREEFVADLIRFHALQAGGGRPAVRLWSPGERR